MVKTVYIYSDESGVFDKEHHDLFVYSGLACIGQDASSILTRRYLLAEKALRKSPRYKLLPELKACLLKNDDKRKLYRIVNDYYKFVVRVDLKRLQDERFENRYSKQRYLDYAFKRGIKDLLIKLSDDGFIDLQEELEIKCYVDEHSRASNGKYTLRDSIFQEFKIGMYYINNDIRPIMPKLIDVSVTYCNSETVPLVKAADILANRYYHEIKETNQINTDGSPISVLRLPPLPYCY